MADNFFKTHQQRLLKLYPGVIEKVILETLEIRPGRETMDALLKGVPISYILGTRFFYDSDFIVTADTLIPRFETEILVDEVLKFFKKGAKIETLCDVGVGSGAMLLSILKVQSIKKNYAIDISSKALEITKLNAIKLGIQNEITYLCMDRLESFREKTGLQHIDVIISNPPYIKTIADRQTVHQQVLLHEPHLALFIDDECYYEWFDLFFEQVSSLTPIFFMMEGHENHLQTLLTRCNSYFPTHSKKIIKDLNGCDRFLLFIQT